MTKKNIFKMGMKWRENCSDHFLTTMVFCFVPTSASRLLFCFDISNMATTWLLFCLVINNMAFVLSSHQQRGFCYVPTLTTWLSKQDKVISADSAFIFLIIQSQNQWSGWSGRRRWSCLVWSLLER